MVLWRPLFDGLGGTLQSQVRGTVGGLGCLIPRASLLAFRAILLRHGRMFSAAQLEAILVNTLLPAIQLSAESDPSPVVRITSESPAMSNIDFLVDSLPLPPPADDHQLRLFEATSSTPSRTMGAAELMLEASYTDLRHGGDGDLRKAYIYAKKSDVKDSLPHDQPFPDSWIATTASMALGFLTDILSEIVFFLDEETSRRIWSLVIRMHKLWFNGPSEALLTGSSNKWQPCEALVRIASREIGRVSERVLRYSNDDSSRKHWIGVVVQLFIELLDGSNKSQERAHSELLRMKEEEKKSSDRFQDSDLDKDVLSELSTSFGRGRLVPEAKSCLGEGRARVIALDFGGVLYQPLDAMDVQGGISRNNIPREVDGESCFACLYIYLVSFARSNLCPRLSQVPPAYFEETVPILKIRCIAAWCLNHALFSSLEHLVPRMEQTTVSTLLVCVEKSLTIAATSVKDETIAMAFQQILLRDWGDGTTMPDDTVEATARLSLQHGSAVFFLAQESGACKALIKFLSMLYLSRDSTSTWNRAAFAEPRLNELFRDSLAKFLASEAEHGHLVDANTWRNAGERFGKHALYCTFFVPVVIELLKLIRSATQSQFAEHKQVYFSSVCSLVRVHSEEIRELVQCILVEQVGPILGVEQEASFGNI